MRGAFVPPPPPPPARFKQRTATAVPSALRADAVREAYTDKESKVQCAF